MIECEYCHEKYEKHQMELVWCVECSTITPVCEVCCDENEIPYMPKDMKMNSIENRERFK